LGELIDAIEVAMLVSTAADGSLISRPLSTLQADFQGDLWFFVNALSGKMDDLARNPHVNLSYANPDKHLYVAVVRRARVLHDPATVVEPWHPRAAAFCPVGRDGPDLLLLKIELSSAEYWQASAGLVRQALRLMHAVNGTGPDDLDQNRELH